MRKSPKKIATEFTALLQSPHLGKLRCQLMHVLIVPMRMDTLVVALRSPQWAIEHAIAPLLKMGAIAFYRARKNAAPIYVRSDAVPRG